jgi:23S rRNA G2069 N7-methylase RlmK/C1962 C5-methylase RlmI
MYAELVRKCRRCKANKSVNEFSRHKKRKDGSWSLRANCKPCNVLAVGEWYQKHKAHSRRQMRERYQNRADVRERVRNEGFKRTYGITVDQYNKMLAVQKNKCAVCNKDQKLFERRFDIDHCHETGTVRGLCCIRCNRGMGLLQDNPQLLRAAADHIEKYKK